jgi:transcriptional regulator with XRE-family HTH domain
MDAPNIGHRIASLRRWYGWTQTELAEQLGVSRMTVYRYEEGGREPSLAMLRRLAEVLEVDVGELVGS